MTIEKNKALLAEFAEITRQNPGPISYSVELGDLTSAKKIFICAAAHGNEVGSIPAVLRFIRDVKKGSVDLRAHVIIALGNIEAIKINERYLEEDLNRAYNTKILVTADAKRAKELGEQIIWADIFMDLHQTIEATEASFYVLRPDKKSENLARSLALAEYAIVIDDKAAESDDKMTATSFGIKHNTACFTLELGQKGYNPAAEDLAYKAIYKFINIYAANDFSQLAVYALKKPELQKIDVSYAHKFTDVKAHLVKGLKNLKFYKKNEIIGFDADGEILTPFDGYIFFPKYPKRDADNRVMEELPTNLFLFGKKI